MSKKSKYTSDQLYESCETTTGICCTKCRKHDMAIGDEFMGCDKFFSKGWRATPNNTYCPECSKKYLKQ